MKIDTALIIFEMIIATLIFLISILVFKLNRNLKTQRKLELELKNNKKAREILKEPSFLEKTLPFIPFMN